MENQFIPYEIAVKLKELGFDEKCFNSYNTNKHYSKDVKNISEWYVKAPLWQQAFDWFRIEHNLYIPIKKVVGNGGTPKETISWTITTNPWDSVLTYEEAREACLLKLIELCKNKQ